MTCAQMFAREISENELKTWADYLKSLPLAELRYAFENWNRNARMFPKPKDIGDLCSAYRLSEINKLSPLGCSRCEYSGFIEVHGTRTAQGTLRTERTVAPCPCMSDPKLREKPESYSHQGEGYGAQDMLWLYERYQQMRRIIKKPLSDANVDQLLDELDQKRGRSPAWRQA